MVNLNEYYYLNVVKMSYKKYVIELNNSDIAWANHLVKEKGNIDGAINDLFEDMDCTTIYPDGSRPRQTINFGYYRAISLILYLLNKFKGECNDDTNAQIKIQTYISRLCKTHDENINFEKDHEPIRYKGKSRVSRKRNLNHNKTKEMFTGETIDVGTGIAKLVKPKKESISSRKNKILSSKSISFAFNNFKTNK